MNTANGKASEACFKKYEDDPDQFTECYYNTHKQTNNLMEKFQFKMFYLNKVAETCLASGN